VTTTTVLLADDHAIVREGLVHILSAQPDIDVVGQADDGKSAVDAVTAVVPDVAVLDISMPGLSGVEAARRIRESCPGTQVVFLSMHSSKEHISRALKAGARGYVLKECAGSELVEAVRAVRRGHSYMSQRVSDVMLANFVEEDKQAPLAPLSDREREVFYLVVEGLSSTDIGRRLSLSPKTIETYRSRIHSKLGTDDVTDLIKFAIRHELISVD
jgi:DNA-binding NarL/FixJ family response regulator